MKRILVMMPTRNRALRALQTYGSWLETRHGCSDFLFCIDHDDVIPRDLDHSLPFLVQRQERMGLAATLNKAVATHPGYTGYMLCADDLIFRTNGWDEILLQACVGVRILWANDTAHGHRLPTHPVLTAKFIEAVGWFAAPGFYHHYIDGVWKLLIERFPGLGVYFPHVIIEHQQGRHERDEVNAHAERMSREVIDDRRLFRHWRMDHLLETLDKLRIAGTLSKV